jgi:hypothetical protein
MTIREAMETVESDKKVLVQAVSDLGTAAALYALGESEKAIDLYGAVRSRVHLAMRSFPVLYE